jgi:uncharacterized protein
MNSVGDNKIVFSGLNEGLHEFEFKLNETFFRQFDSFGVENGECQVNVVFKKTAILLSLSFDFKGFVKCFCDRCGDDLNLELKGVEEYFIKFGEPELDTKDDHLLFLKPEAYQIELDSIFFEILATSIPVKRVHEEAECNTEVIEKLNDYSEASTDPRWDQLKKLLNTN